MGATVAKAHMLDNFPKIADEVSRAINGYGAACEESGFVSGFRVAVRMMAECFAADPARCAYYRADAVDASV